MMIGLEAVADCQLCAKRADDDGDRKLMLQMTVESRHGLRAGEQAGGAERSREMDRRSESSGGDWCRRRGKRYEKSVRGRRRPTGANSRDNSRTKAIDS